VTAKPSPPILYFAYALDLNKKQMKERAPESKPRMTAVLPNYRLVFLGWSRQWKGGIATVRGAHGSRVAGGVYEITEKDQRRLDALEGYPRESSRLSVTVFSEDGDAIRATTYVKTGQLEETRPSAEYLAVIQTGYREWGIV
jgi:gamma-glutamylcyclotransferase